MPKVVLLFGGAFDPPHKGHAATALRALSVSVKQEPYLLHELWLLPSFSDTFGQKNMAAAEHRVAMTRLLAQYCVDPKVKVSTYEIEMANEAGTYAVVRSLMNKYPDIRFKYVIGSDQAFRIREWRNSRELLKTIPFIVIKRYGSVNLEMSEFTWYKKEPHTLDGKQIMANVISSTKIRERLRNAKRRAELLNPMHVNEFLDRGVLQYIYQNSLYK